ncbi:MAG: methyltransferase domain-containing protein [Proteobacteria bacterium]|nr:methyltransferase domain-containing protein [Pseudomonadota bacterium]
MPFEEKNNLYIAPDIFGIYSTISWQVRKKIFDSFMSMAQPTAQTTVLDVGVTSDRRRDSNFFEKLYPYPHRITAIGTEDVSFLEQEFPGLTYIKTEGSEIPFPDKSFDLVVSFATIEHVGSRDNQRRFISELCRLGSAVCIATPNRWYPIEFHTVLPFVHWFPPDWFRVLCRWLGKEFLAREENLNLLTERETVRLFPAGKDISVKYIRLLGLVSNLVFYAKV